MKVLLIEDSHNVAQVIFDYFEDTDVELDYAGNGLQGLDLARSQVWDCIILDVMLPGMDGMEICAKLRNDGNSTPILMLTARDADQDMIDGLGQGADDYLVKPFNLEVLEARIHSLYRRHLGQGFNKNLQFGDLTIDLTQHLAFRHGQALKLTPVGFKILNQLVIADGGVITRQQLEQQIWPDDLPDTDVLRKHMYQLRNQLDKPFDFSMLETVPKIGYRLRKES